MSTKLIWEAVPDDDLLYAQGVFEFLRSEFQPLDVDEIWFKEYFNWKLGHQNPAGRGYLTVGLVDGKIIAVTSLTRKRILLDGKEYIGAEFGDSYCSSKFFDNINSYIPKESDSRFPAPNHYLNKSIFGRIAYDTTLRALADGVQILYGTPNENAFPSWIKRLGHFSFEGHNIYNFSRSSFRDFASRYRYLKPFKFLLKKGDGVISYANKSYLKLKSGKIISIERAFPPAIELDDLWVRVRPSKGFSLVRDFLYWNYRYFTHPERKYTTYTIRSAGLICGIVSICIHKVAFNTYRCYFVEWMIAPGHSLAQIISEIIFHLRNEPIDYFATYCDLTMTEADDFRMNFFEKGSKVSITFFSTDLLQPHTLINKPFRFYLGSTDAL